jgi:hypothetical protein
LYGFIGGGGRQNKLVNTAVLQMIQKILLTLAISGFLFQFQPASAQTIFEKVKPQRYILEAGELDYRGRETTCKYYLYKVTETVSYKYLGIGSIRPIKWKIKKKVSYQYWQRGNQLLNCWVRPK